MKTLTVNIYDLPDEGLVKAAVFEGTNKFLFEVKAYTEYGALAVISRKYAWYLDTQRRNEAFDGRAL